ncbi:magnesium transporter [Aerococcaceae bacterium zg-ZJ1578]|uniref:magnesium transporter n=1 Tax=Aerococcaceae TaxID=186827 RepID=UPI0013BD660B|nr:MULTISPECIES: magnesium transporter [unclassified Facklamia]MBK0347606.1 magnesium transporter [Aerococcaceae bacterium zg-1578]MBR7926634.1 magnesium transporter [Aerococcaceae bacterium zg-ZUI334]MBS4461587.1 magnesium transporter [Aerococcaceae bacterium zg-B36]QQD65228.1 magnesium transporter [Aerococcaceae bacterium zg-252]NEW63880.1 magnesium transporter [Facklamia sp. 252]
MEVFERTFEEHVEVIQQLLNNNRMTRFRSEFLALHQYDQAKIFEAIAADERQKVYQYLSPSELASLFDAFEAEDVPVNDYFEEMNPNYAASVLGEMYADNAVDILNNLTDKENVKVYMQLMKPESAREISQLINYLPDTAGSIMTTEFVWVDENFTVREAYEHLKEAAIQAETIYYIYAVDANRRLSGVISLRDLIINEDARLIKDVMNPRVITVQVSDGQEEVARMVQDYDLLALPVVGFDRELLGIITVDDVLDVIQEEADSDYSGLAAVNVNEEHMSPWSAAKSRLPWLITLLFLGMGTATLISQYEELIASASVLSAFVTLITGTAGNAGTQSLAVAVRKITNKSEDDNFFQSLMFEILTGLIKGVIVGATIAIVAGIWQKNLVLGAIIGISMATAIFVANLAGSLIPKLMARLGFDPAVASGPFISTLSDLTSVLIYFSIASAFMQYLF